MSETFEHRDMSGSCFLDINLANARFENVNLSGTLFDNVYMAGATVSNANLQGFCVKDAYVAGMTVNGFSITELIDAEMDRRDPERLRLRIKDTSDPQAVREMVARLEKLRNNFCSMLRSKKADVLALRPAPKEWSAIECVRHLVFAEDLYINREIQNNHQPLNPVGMLPDFALNDPQYADAGKDPAVDLETVLAAWQKIHTVTRQFLAAVTSDELKRNVNTPGNNVSTVGGVLQVMAQHDLIHIRQAEAALAVAERGK
jgi:hypothetical protein